MMLFRTPSYYSEFECIAGDCPDSCCQGWEVDADENALAYYKTLKGDFRNRIDNVLDIGEYNNTVFRLAPKKRCPFLNDNNLCDMHIAIGGEHTPETCRNFPRFSNDYGSVREIGISFSCPAASDIMFNYEDKFDFSEEINDLQPSLNDIDAELYFILLKGRKKAFSIIQDNNMPLNERLILLLEFAKSLQDDIGVCDEGERSTSFFDVFVNPEIVNPEWGQKVKSGSEQTIRNTKWGENIACYFIYRYFLNAVYDMDVLSTVKMAVVGVILTNYFGSESWTIHLWSKEIEHSRKNFDAYRLSLKNEKCLSVQALIERLKLNK